MLRRLISFDWALKRLLRSKAHFGILEGFLSELLQDDIQILEILDSEGGRDTPIEKLNRVDLCPRKPAWQDRPKIDEDRGTSQYA